MWVFFITSSTRDVHPVTRVDDRELEAGPVTLALRTRFEQAARSEVDP